MIHFDYYDLIDESDDVSCDKSPLLSSDTLSVNQSVWLDEVDGFWDAAQPFLPGKAIGSILRLVIKEQTCEIARWFGTDNDTYFEAEILENLDYCARVRITFIDRFGHWVRTVPLLDDQDVSILPDTVLNEVKRLGEHISWGVELPDKPNDYFPNNTRIIKGPDGEDVALIFYVLPNELRCVIAFRSPSGGYLIRV